MNSCNFIGNLGQDPKFYASNGNNKSFVTFSLGVANPFQKDAQGKPMTDWIDCKAFGKTADLIGKYVTKGTRLGITSRASKEKYQDKNGNDVYSTKFIVENITFCEKGNGGNNNNTNSNADNFSQGRQQQAPSVDPYVLSNDDDLPF